MFVSVGSLFRQQSFENIMQICEGPAAAGFDGRRSIARPAVPGSE